MKLFQENPIFETVKSKVIISLFETVRFSVSISPKNLYNSLKRIKEKSFIISGPVLSLECGDTVPTVLIGRFGLSSK